MGEIDDNYNEKLEVLENDFFEELKKGRERKKVVENYHKSLDKTVKNFERQYEKSLKRERDIVSKRKAKKQNPITYDHLEVEHFNFNFSRIERFKMKWALFWFRTGRYYRNNLLGVIPADLMYYHYKTKILIKNFFTITRGIIMSIFEGLWHLVIRIYYLIFHGILGLFHMIIDGMKKVLGKIHFKKEEKKETKEEVKKEDEKTSES